MFYRQVPFLEQMKEHRNMVGPIIRECREAKGLSQEQLVAKINVMGWDLSRASLAKIETQIRCVADYELPILADAVGIEVSVLLARALEKHSKRRRNA
jgi:transcriptional regulator with XRE-family HTH domain